MGPVGNGHPHETKVGSHPNCFIARTKHSTMHRLKKVVLLVDRNGNVFIIYQLWLSHYYFDSSSICVFGKNETNCSPEGCRSLWGFRAQLNIISLHTSIKVLECLGLQVIAATRSFDFLVIPIFLDDSVTEPEHHFV